MRVFLNWLNDLGDWCYGWWISLFGGNDESSDGDEK